MTLLWVVVAGGLGSGARYLVGVWAAAAFGAAFPIGTLIVNLAGCFLLGFLAPFTPGGWFSTEVRTAIGAGFLGGFTTYSSFNQETLLLLSDGAVAPAALNIVITLVGGLAAGTMGMLAARALQS
jgi:fluoride exporter